MPVRKLRKLKKVTQPEATVYPELDNLRSLLKELQQVGIQNRTEYLATEAAILAFCAKHDIEKYDRGPGRSVTPVHPMGEEVDWDGIKKRLTPKQWAMILADPKPDKSKLQAALEVGAIKRDDIKPFVHDKPIKPYVNLN